MSNATVNRTCPMCGEPWTVRPHTYIPTAPGRSGSKSRSSRVAVSYRRRLTGQGYRRLGSTKCAVQHLRKAAQQALPALRVVVRVRLVQQARVDSDTLD